MALPRHKFMQVEHPGTHILYLATTAFPSTQSNTCLPQFMHIPHETQASESIVGPQLISFRSTPANQGMVVSLSNELDLEYSSQHIIDTEQDKQHACYYASPFLDGPQSVECLPDRLRAECDDKRKNNDRKRRADPVHRRLHEP